MTEPTAGTDAQLPYDAPDGGPMLEAVRDGDEIVLNGVKTYISFSNVADVIIVFARTDKSVGATQGMTAFIVTKDTPGFSVARTFDLHGSPARAHRRAALRRLPHPAGEPADALEWRASPRWRARASAATGSARGASVSGAAALEMAVEYAKTRVQGGKPIIEHQMVARQLGEMAMTIEAARNTIWKAAWGHSIPDQADPIVLRMARVLGSEAAMKVALDAVRHLRRPGHVHRRRRREAVPRRRDGSAPRAPGRAADGHRPGARGR